MAYDENLADRVRELIGAEAAVAERSMFGGLAFLVDGHMAVAVSGRGGVGSENSAGLVMRRRTR
jgi:TfoX/Sxy family transcriptional regulator of competence genes